MNVERHILEPFVFDDSEVLMLGSFPPKKEKWLMQFYYPNFQNDMWRIFGLIFGGDKEYFLDTNKARFNKKKICEFLQNNKIAVGDAALSIIRHKDNASDKFLEVVEHLDFSTLLIKLSRCRAIIVTGEKAGEIVQNFFRIEMVPKIGEGVEFSYEGRRLMLYRAPSSSRAYPKSIEDKAKIYKNIFNNVLDLKSLSLI